jgi:hypothetical protein
MVSQWERCAHLIMAWLQEQFTRERPDTFTQTAFDSSQEPLQRRGGDWPAPGSEDTKLRCLLELEVCHGATGVYAGVQA